MAVFNNSRFFKPNIELKGVFPSPFIESVSSGNFDKNTTQTVTISGLNFVPETTVIINEASFSINSVNYLSPTTLTASITSGNVLGTFDLIVTNNLLGSGTSGAGAIKVKNSVWVDLRTAPILSLGLEVTTGVIINQDAARGLWTSGTGSFWNRGVKFTANQWNREGDIEFSFVFQRSGDGTCMFGVGGDNIDVNGLGNQSYYRAETQLYHANTQTNTFYGGGIEANWNQNIETTVTFAVDTFYKVKFHQSGVNGTLISIYEVDPNNFDNEITLLHQWTSNSPAADPLLMPFWAAPSTPNVFLTAFKIF